MDINDDDHWSLWIELSWEMKPEFRQMLASFLPSKEATVAFDAISMLLNTAVAMAEDAVQDREALLILVEKGYIDLQITKNWRGRICFEYLPSRSLAARLTESGGGYNYGCW